MPLHLHPNCLARLKTTLAAQLAHAKVHNGKFLTPETSLYLFLAQASLPTTGDINTRLKKLISDAPLVDFVSGTLARELQETREYDANQESTALSSLPEYSDLDSLAHRLVTEFDSLPWRYTVTFPLPSSFSEVFCSGIRKFHLSDSVSIKTGDAAFAEEFPSFSGIDKRDRSIKGGGLLSILASGGKPIWNSDRSYLQVRLDGFIGKYTNTEPLQSTRESLRSFLGLAIALRLFDFDSKYRPFPAKEKHYVHRCVNNAWIIEDALDLDSRYTEAMVDLKLHSLDGSLDSVDKKLAWMRRQLESISTVFRSAEHARSIARGAQWLFDSHCGNDQLLQFVQAAVVIEILLGEKAVSDITGLGELLSNRCAYLIAVSHSQRNELLQDFRRIYEVRSKIVHRGKSRLGPGEWSLFNKLRWMCRRIIQEEIGLLNKDVEKDA
jgi:hypothetical protein